MFSNSEALSRASHELRTPLNAILGFGQLLQLDELNESQRHSVEQIMAGGRHLLALIEDLLDLSRLDASGLELKPVDVGAEIAEAVSLCTTLATEGSLSITIEAGNGPQRALADPRRLKQVLLNLISNAIKYNRPGGSITVRAERDGDDGVRIDVIDSGVGMSYQQLTRLFQPFERLDAPARGIDGNGLGLAVSKALVEAMHGTIDVASTPGAGSIFSVRLPATVSVTVPAATAAIQALPQAA
ncbi:MAG TPA: HAMP domain-containing sensor histidine kinase [Solirubrobacteraceae bacterium]|nr:HAMP domain-containing sensor histidine kinase [Solirubrobacteraceae bacterium]